MRITIDWCQTCRNGIHPAKRFADTDFSKAAEVVMDISPHGLAFILRLETGEKSVRRMTSGKDEQRRKKIKHHAAEVSKRLRVPLNQMQFDAMVSFAFSVGINTFQETNVLTRLNARDYPGAAEALLLWVYAGGRPAQHLIARRKEEHQLFLSV